MFSLVQCVLSQPAACLASWLCTKASMSLSFQDPNVYFLSGREPQRFPTAWTQACLPQSQQACRARPAPAASAQLSPPPASGHRLIIHMAVSAACVPGTLQQAENRDEEQWPHLTEKTKPLICVVSTLPPAVIQSLMRCQPQEFATTGTWRRMNQQIN